VRREGTCAGVPPCWCSTWRSHLLTLSSPFYTDFWEFLAMPVDSTISGGSCRFLTIPAVSCLSLLCPGAAKQPVCEEPGGDGGRREAAAGVCAGSGPSPAPRSCADGEGERQTAGSGSCASTAPRRPPRPSLSGNVRPMCSTCPWGHPDLLYKHSTEYSAVLHNAQDSIL